MDSTLLSILVLIAIVLIVWAIAKFVLKLARGVVNIVLTILIAGGLLLILFLFIL